jgi:glycosyltransferase involved in cell wall biosynthesis
MTTVLSVYNAYLNRGGEDEVFDNEADLLESKGHRVIRFRVEADPLRSPSPLERVKLAATTIWSPHYAREFDTMLADCRPDVVHFHNTFPLISPSALAVCQSRGYPVVHSIHNYRLVCPSATMFRDGRACDDCVGRTPPYPGVLHSCYHESRVQTGVIAATLTAHRLRGTWRTDVDRYIALTDFARRMLVRGGIPENLIAVKPNFPSVVPTELSRTRSGFLFVGRLSPEKGIPVLLAASGTLNQNSSIRIAGNGPLQTEVDNAQQHALNLKFLGRIPSAEVFQEMNSVAALVFPSVWYEGFPVTIVEAFSQATPVIASRLGSMAEIIADGVTGLLFEPGDGADLADKMRWAAAHPDEMRRMGENARREYEAKYTPQRNYEMLMAIYEDAIAHARARRA